MDVTVIIPTLNGEKYLERVFAAIATQQFDGTVEVLVIDSGSTDRTIEIVEAHPDVRLHQIPNSEFGHGRTRNLAARLAEGTNLAYLTQDAIPFDSHWLSELLAPLDPAGLDAVAVLGKQVPRPDCVPLLKYEIDGIFARFGDVTTLTTDTFYSDVNSATRRQFLLEVIPYQDLRYSEDMAYATDIVQAGYRLAWSPGGAVEHSNDLELGEYSKRIFDETMSMRRLGHAPIRFNRWRQVLHTGYGILRDSSRIIRDGDYGFGRKLYWLAVNPLFQVAKWQGYYRGSRTALDDHATINAHSLEAQRMQGSRD
ncbi:MAG: glycosyltransferase family 2 protein [Microbacteriaceae bacterium]|nr:glycosyltransferase family 2 protein [Microbacteriaceae bacterium]